MSAIIHYKCNNPECNFKTKKEAHFPIWKSDSPKEMRKIPVGIRFKDYIAGYIDRRYCITCKVLQPYLQGSNTCLICNTEDLYIKDGDMCPMCNIGVINEIEGINIRF